jgi:hypothetical protein
VLRGGRLYSPPPLPLGTLSRTPCMPAGTRFRMTWEWTLPVKTGIPWGLFIAADRRSVNRAGDGPRFADQAGSAWSRRTSPRRAVRPRIDRRFGRQPFPAAARPGLTNVAIFVGARAAGQVARRAENADAGHEGVARAPDRVRRDIAQEPVFRPVRQRRAARGPRPVGTVIIVGTRIGVTDVSHTGGRRRIRTDQSRCRDQAYGNNTDASAGSRYRARHGSILSGRPHAHMCVAAGVP